MKIGIISDSHDNLENLKKTIQIFKDNNIEAILHAGDLISPFCVVPFSDFKGKFYVCAGNNLGDEDYLRELIAGIGHYFKYVGRIELADKTFALYHGTSDLIVEALLKSQLYDYVIVGHTHKKETKTHGKTILINPGELYGNLFGEATFAILETTTNRVEFHKLDC